MEGRAWDLADWYANAEKAALQLGWKASIALDDGLQATARWVRTSARQTLPSARSYPYATGAA